MPADNEPTPEWRRVETWRRKQLERAGYPGDYADGLSKNPGVDLHQAIRLLEAGCPLETAMLILR